MQTKAMPSAAPVLEASASSLQPNAAPVLAASAASVQPQPIDIAAIAAALAKAKQHADQWLDQRSDFFSRIGEMPVTRRLALRVNLVAACFVIGALAVAVAPLASATAAATAAWLTYRLNHNADANKMVKKGGRS